MLFKALCFIALKPVMSTRANKKWVHVGECMFYSTREMCFCVCETVEVQEGWSHSEWYSPPIHTEKAWGFATHTHMNANTKQDKLSQTSKSSFFSPKQNSHTLSSDNRSRWAISNWHLTRQDNRPGISSALHTHTHRNRWHALDKPASDINNPHTSSCLRMWDVIKYLFPHWPFSLEVNAKCSQPVHNPAHRDLPSGHKIDCTQLFLFVSRSKTSGECVTFRSSL